MAQYKQIYHHFEVGQVLPNNNGRDYKVIEVSSQSEVLFERCSDGERVLASNPKMFEKTVCGLTTTVLEWGMGKYFRKEA